MGGRGFFGLVALLIIGAIVTASMYTVDQREKAIVFRFGEIIRTSDEPGLHFKMPIVNNVRKFDARIRTMDAAAESYLTKEKKNLLVDSFIKWRILDVGKYYVTVGGQTSAAENRLRQKVNDSLRREFGFRSVAEVISGDRAKIMEIVRKAVNTEAESLGIEVVDVRLKRVDLDDAISNDVYKRMKAERSRVAAELRAQGAEKAEQIRADADRQAKIEIANAVRKSEEVRGDGDAEATAIYAETFGRDREFYNFYRSLSAYRETFGDKGDLIVLEPDSEFFKYFKNSGGESPAPAGSTN